MSADKELDRSEELTGSPPNHGTSRRDVLRGGVVVAGGLATAAVIGSPKAAAAEGQTENPYGSRPGGGISLPDDDKPWPAINNHNVHIPYLHTCGEDLSGSGKQP
jgi:hypothetical protein